MELGEVEFPPSADILKPPVKDKGESGNKGLPECLNRLRPKNIFVF